MNEKQQEVYGTMCEETWIIQKDLLNVLKTKYRRDYKSRALRQIIKECRMLYKEDKLPLLIIKSNKGYKLSNDYDEICRFAKELISTGESMKTEGMELLDAAGKHRIVKEKEDILSRCSAVEDYSRDKIEKMIQEEQFSHLQLIEIVKCMTASISYADILMLAKADLHPYIMFLGRKGMLEGMDRQIIRIYADAALTTGNAYKLYHAAANGCSMIELNRMKKEMRDVESKKTDQE
ncbi:hypothetical protein DWW36_02360 [Erysipelotrichaceae bacterium AF15-26LB]|nr:hypothetical protein HMPREF0983_01699 [Erysipelotrichaceae bacterium 3_1_53]MCR0347749.1 hypothetical protein [[Clostridium] innocuum]RJV92422.1 hypothetical protein DWW36_02360 [Erysipelotrichaceae bacterium AF15-26LB]RJV92671.1 hypothetical protein DWX45_02805 [Erysipelotrichaceae bacterium AF19-24AC]